MSLRAAMAWCLTALVLGGVWLSFDGWDASDRPDGQRLFPKVWRDVAEISLLRGGIPATESIDLFPVKPKEGDPPLPPGAEPWRFRVNEGAADDLNPLVIEELKALLTLAQRQPAPPGTEPVSPLASAQIALTDTQGRRYAFFVPPADPGAAQRRLAALDDVERTLLLDGELLKMVDRPAGDFRRPELFDLTGVGRQLAGIMLDPGSDRDMPSQEPVALLRTPNGWRMERPVRWPADERELERLLGRIQALRFREVAVEYPDEETLASMGLGAGAARVRLEVIHPDGTTGFQTVSLGRVRGEGAEAALYARAEGREPVFLVPPDLAFDLQRGRVLDPEHPDGWSERYRLRSIPLIGNWLRPPAGGVAVTAPSGERMHLRPIAPGERIDGVLGTETGVLAANGPGATLAGGTPAEPETPWIGEVRDAQGRLVDRFPADPQRRDELLVMMSGLPVDAFLPAPPDPVTHDAGRRGWQGLSFDAAGNVLATARLLEAPDAPPVAPLPDGRVGTPDPAGLGSLEAAFGGFDARARLASQVSGVVGRPFFRYRDRRLAELDYAKVSWVRVEWSGQVFAWRREGENAWRQTEPTEALVVDEQHHLVQTLLLLTRMEVIDWVARGTDGDEIRGLEPAQGRILVGGGEGPEASRPVMDLRLGTAVAAWGFLSDGSGAPLLVAGAAAEGVGVKAPEAGDFPPVYARVEGRPETFLFYGPMLERLLRRYR